MKFYMFAGLAAVAMASTANAQDASPFAGPYVGLQGSVAQIDDVNTDLDYWYTGTDVRTSDRGGMIGLRAGYDMVAGPLLYGALIEGSIGKLDSYEEVGTSGDLVFENGTKVKKLGSVRAKLGLNSGNLAAFVTGGFAFSDAKQRYFETDGTDEAYSGKGDRSGYVLGLGAAYAINANSSLGLEYSHYEFGSRTHDLLEDDGSDTDYDFREDYKVRALTISFNYGF